MTKSSQVIDLHSLRKPLTETKTAIGSVVHGDGISVSAGKYLDFANTAHVAVRIRDPHIRDGEPRYYLIPRANALALAEALQKAASEVSI